MQENPQPTEKQGGKGGEEGGGLAHSRPRASALPGAPVARHMMAHGWGSPCAYLLMAKLLAIGYWLRYGLLATGYCSWFQSPTTLLTSTQLPSSFESFLGSSRTELPQLLIRTAATTGPVTVPAG